MMQYNKYDADMNSKKCLFTQKKVRHEIINASQFNFYREKIIMLNTM